MNKNEERFYADALSTFDQYVAFRHFNNHKLIKVIRDNEEAIANNTEIVNKKFGLKLDKPKLYTGIEQEMLSVYELDEIKKFELRRNDRYYFDRDLSLEENLRNHNFIFDDHQTVKIKDDEQLFKSEVKTLKPTSVGEQLFNYSRMLFLFEQTLGLGTSRYSGQINYSLHSTGEPDKKNPFRNIDLREFIGNNVLKFMDEALPLLDTRTSIMTQGGKQIENGGITTDRVSYFDQESDNMRCRFLLAFRSKDKINPEVVDNEAGGTSSAISPERHEFRRVMPGAGPQNYQFCDSTVIAYALITSAIRHGFETGIQEMVKPYNYRGSDYNEHMFKMRESKLLRQYLGDDNVDMLTRELFKYNVNKELEEKGFVNMKDYEFNPGR